MTRPRPRPCITCGRRVDDGQSRCELHRVQGARPTSCQVCGIRILGGRFCDQHSPEVDEAARDARNPYRRSYRDPAYKRSRWIAFERQHGRCATCGCELLPGQWESDHVIELRDGGTNEAANLRALCIPCHRKKTAAARRARARNNPPV